MTDPIRLSRSFPSRYGVPRISRVDPRIFRLTYFTHCLKCDFCNDACCQHGVDVDRLHYDNILRHAEALEKYTGIPRDRWFDGKFEKDPEVPGGATTRTRVENGGCVFLNRPGRGCKLHAYFLEQGMDPREYKSMVDFLFPITFDEGLLHPSEEVLDGELVCTNTGPTLYRGLREELEYYFGREFVTVLDELEEI